MTTDKHTLHFFVFQALQQKTLGPVSTVMTSLGLTSFLNTDLKLLSTMCPGNTNRMYRLFSCV